MLGIVLAVIGVVFIVGISPLSLIWPAGWSWGPGNSHYLMMILGLYATLGVFLLIASRNPPAHRSLIWFTVWSSVVHAVIMAVQAFGDPAERGHLWGDVPALLVIAIVLAALTPRGRPMACSGLPGRGAARRPHHLHEVPEPSEQAGRSARHHARPQHLEHLRLRRH